MDDKEQLSWEDKAYITLVDYVSKASPPVPNPESVDRDVLRLMYIFWGGFEFVKLIEERSGTNICDVIAEYHNDNQAIVIEI